MTTRKVVRYSSATRLQARGRSDLVTDTSADERLDGVRVHLTERWTDI
jgi:hypothetical protein